MSDSVAAIPCFALSAAIDTTIQDFFISMPIPINLLPVLSHHTSPLIVRKVAYLILFLIGDTNVVSVEDRRTDGQLEHSLNIATLRAFHSFHIPLS